MKSVIEDVFKCVMIMIIHVHPGSFFSIINGEFSRGNEIAGEFATREKPTKLNTEEQKEEVDVTRKVFVLHLNACCCERIESYI